MDLFTSYEERTFEFESPHGKHAQRCWGWVQGGCNIVWSHILPSIIALDGERICGKKSVLELGAGCGLVGLLAANLGHAASVDITDGDEEEVGLIQKNCDEHGASGRCVAHFLTWGKPAAAEHLVARGGRRYDVILASQVVYVPAAIPLLVETIAALLAADGEALLYNDAVSVMASQADCRRLLDDALAECHLVAESLDPARQWRSDLVFPHADAYLLRIRHAGE